MNSKTRSVIFYLIILAISVIFPVPRNMNESFTCLVYDQADSSYCSSATVTFEGRYNDYLVRKDRFDGTISIHGLDAVSSDSIDCDLIVYKYAESVITSSDSGTSLSFHGTEKMDEFIISVRTAESADGASNQFFITSEEMTIEKIHSKIG